MVATAHRSTGPPGVGPTRGEAHERGNADAAGGGVPGPGGGAAGVRRPGRQGARQGAPEPGHDPRRQGCRGQGSRGRHRQPPGTQGRRLGWRGRRTGRAVRPTAARLGRCGCCGRRGRGQVRRQQGDRGHPVRGEREPQAWHRRDHRRVPRGAAPGRRTGPARLAAEIGGRVRREGHRRAHAGPRRGDGQVQPRPHSAARSPPSHSPAWRVARSMRRSGTGASSRR